MEWGVDFIHLIQERDSGGLFTRLMNLKFPKNVEDFLGN
jgi:hypothetical protein